MMTEKSWDAEMAGHFRKRDNQPYEGLVIGTVVAPPPEIIVRHPAGLMLDKDNLVIASHVLAGYGRSFSISESTVGTGVVTLKPIPSGSPQDYQIQAISTSESGNMTVTTTDTLSRGDQVILVPTGDGQLYALVDKAVTL